MRHKYGDFKVYHALAVCNFVVKITESEWVSVKDYNIFSAQL